MDTKLIVSASPHVRSDETTQSLMANVIVALCPCVVASAIIFGVRALLVTAVSVVACVAFEWLYCKLLKRANPISDLSAVVTGIILAMNVPVGMPIGQLIIGDLVAIIVVKQLFGGIGMNIAKYFSYLLAAEDTTLHKPNAEPVKKTLNELSYNAQDTLVVGDMPFDILMGKNAGVYTCGVTYGVSGKNSLLEAGADWVIDDISELLEIV